jgi:hypothetical protein
MCLPLPPLGAAQSVKVNDVLEACSVRQGPNGIAYLSGVRLPDRKARRANGNAAAPNRSVLQAGVVVCSGEGAKREAQQVIVKGCQAWLSDEQPADLCVEVFQRASIDDPVPDRLSVFEVVVHGWQTKKSGGTPLGSGS